MIRVQLHGSFAVVVDGRSIAQDLPGRRGRLLVAYLAANPRTGGDRHRLIDLLSQPGTPGPGAAAGFAALLSKTRAVLAPVEIGSRQNLRLVLPPGSIVDATVAAAALHEAEAAAGRGDWRRSWTEGVEHAVRHPARVPGRSRPPLDRRAAPRRRARPRPGADPTELASAERSARRLIASQPLSETGYCLLMRALAARGDRGAALAVFGELRAVLRTELGTTPGPVAAAVHARLL